MKESGVVFLVLQGTLHALVSSQVSTDVLARSCTHVLTIVNIVVDEVSDVTVYPDSVPARRYLNLYISPPDTCVK